MAVQLFDKKIDKMIIVKLCGGLGNQLFQYALGRHLAGLNQTELQFDASLLDKPHDWTYRKYGLGAFNIKATQATEVEIRQMTGCFRFSKWSRVLGLTSKRHFIEPHFHFCPSILKLKGSFYLDGYWQSEKYFSDIAAHIREELTPTFTLSKSLESIIKQIAEVNSISIHIRRGDYLKVSKANRYLKPCDTTYYQKAIDCIAKKMDKPTFFVFSDDMAWVKQNLKLPFPTHYIEGNTPQEDLLLMASCQHHIIANSTFGWWGAWLNPDPYKIVIAPQQWFATERFNTQDLLPDTWIRL